VVEQKVLHGSPEEDQMLLSRSALLARIITTLAGRVTEQVVLVIQK
jgi:ATP-dependent Zn protease